MKQLLLPLLGAAAFIIIVGLIYNNKLPINPQQNNNSQTSNYQAKIGETQIDLEISDSQEERAKGLSGRSSIDEGKGMLFVFDKKDTRPGFWMKGMKMPIDIVWINDSKIVQIDSKVQPPKDGQKEYQTYFPNSDIDFVLEVASGYTQKADIKVNDLVELPKGY